MADLAVWQRTIVDEEGNVVPGAEVEVRREEDGSLATLYADRAGESPLANPLAADMSGFVRFFAQGDAYTITAVGAGSTRTWRFDPTGRLQEFDRISEALGMADGADTLETRRQLGEFATVADVEASHIPPVLESITVRGIYYDREANEPSHNSKVQSADGSWWVPVVPFGYAFDSVSDMQVSRLVTPGARVRTLGYYSPGDGGGNDYEIVTAGTGTDDGGSFIDLSGSGLQAKGLFPHMRVYVEQFGAVGDARGDDGNSSTDDSQVFQKAIDYLNAELNGRDGGVLFLNPSRAYLLDSPVYVPNNVRIDGVSANMGAPSSFSYEDYGSRLVIGGDYGLFLWGGSQIRNLVIQRKGLQTPFPDDPVEAQNRIDNYSGTAIMTNGGDISLYRLLILGFEHAVRTHPTDGRPNGRGRYEFVVGDCTNGITIDRGGDVPYIYNCHFWPYLTTHLTNSRDVAHRSGTAYRIIKGDWIRLVSCFAYGYNTGFHVDGANTVELIACGSDNNLPNQATGFLITGEARRTSLVSCQVAAHDIGINVDTESTFGGMVSIVNHQSWNQDDVHIRLSRGGATISNSHLAGKESTTGIRVLNTFDYAVVTDTFFQKLSAFFIQAGAIENVSIGPNIYQNCTNTRDITYPKSSIKLGDVTDDGRATKLLSGGAIKVSGGESSEYKISSDELANYGGPHSGTWLLNESGQSTFFTSGNFHKHVVDWGSGAQTDLVFNATELRPNPDNQVSLGNSSRRWSEVYSANSTISTSDEREKQQVRSLAQSEKAVAQQLKTMIRAFKWNHAVEEKGASARWHFGVLAQQVRDVFSDNGLDAHDYGLFCYDEWPEKEAVVHEWDAEYDTEGNVIREAGSEVLEPYQPAGNRFGIRYEELLAFIISAL